MAFLDRGQPLRLAAATELALERGVRMPPSWRLGRGVQGYGAAAPPPGPLVGGTVWVCVP